MAGPVIVYRTKYARNDWWMFALFILASAAISGIIGYAMRRDEIVAARVRAEHVARTLAVQFANEAATPGSDFAGTLPFLAAAMGEQAHLSVVQGPSADEPSPALTGRYVGHSDVARVGHDLDARDPSDKWALELMSRAHREPEHIAIIWHEGLVNAAAVASAGYTAIVDGLRPAPPSQRPALFAIGMFLFLLVFGAGFQDVLYKFGQVLNFAVIAGVTFVAIRLGTALEPSLWRGVASDPLVVRAESLKLADIARIMSQDLPPHVSAITEWGARAAWGAVGFYLIALFGLWHRLGRVVGRDARAYRYVAPAVGTFAACAGLPLLIGIGLAFWRVTPEARTYLGVANFTAFMKDSPVSPTSLWRTLFSSSAWVVSSAALQLVWALALTLIIAQVHGRWRGLYRALFLIPWAMPAYVGALLWSHLWQQSAEPLSAWLGIADTSWLAHPLTAFSLNLLASAWMGAPILMAVGLALLKRITEEQWDAARLEGITGFSAVRYLMWPVLRPLLWPGFAFALFWSLNSFAVVDLISGGGPDGATDLLITRAYHWAFERNEYGYAAAWSVVAFLLAGLMAVAVIRVMRGRPATEPMADDESLPAMPALAFEAR